VRKISGSTKPSKANEAACDRAVEQVAATSRELLNRLCDDETKVAQAEAATGRVLDALYGFLDSVTA